MKNKKSTVSCDRLYICECGKEFTNSQSFNGHKCHCTIHRQFNNTLDAWNIVQRERAKSISRSLKKASENKRLASFEKWLSEHHTCELCGKVMTDRYASGRFCSRSCANTRHLSNTKIGVSGKRVRKYYRHCAICGKGIGTQNVTGLCMGCLLNSKEGREKLEKIAEKISITNRNLGSKLCWKPRDSSSYPEKFFESVLKNENIKFEREYKVNKEGKGCFYFLDFYIVVNDKKIDLEIDGKQHNLPDRHEKDVIRDKFMEESGYIVYRIPWNEINSVKGSEKMKNKIDMFLDFYRSL